MRTEYRSQAGRDRLELILAVLFDEAPHALEGRTYVQKLTFLLQQEADIRGFVSEGGHPFDPSNLQTLCSECHKDKTAQENSERTQTPSRGELSESLFEYVTDGV